MMIQINKNFYEMIFFVFNSRNWWNSTICGKRLREQIIIDHIADEGSAHYVVYELLETAATRRQTRKKKLQSQRPRRIIAH